MFNYDIEKAIKTLKEFGYFDKILTDREHFMKDCEAGEKYYEIGKIFGCEIGFTVKYDYRLLEK